MAIFKFFVAVILLPVVYASAVSFKLHLAHYPSAYDDIFSCGLGAFLLIYIFVYQFDAVNEFGQKISQGLFKVFSPFDRLISYLFPFYPIVICALFFVNKNFLKIEANDDYFLFFIGFSIAMHILLTAQNLQVEERTAIKPHYLLNIALIFIFNAALLVLLLDTINLKMTFPKYFSLVLENSKEIYLSLIGYASR